MNGDVSRPLAQPLAPLISRPSIGRVFSASRPVRLGDVGADGFLRLDATARYLQDVANDDSNDAGLEDPMGWVVRSAAIEVRKAAVFNEIITIRTWCSGTGGRWAERRTSLDGEHGAQIEAVAMWVRWDVQSGRPQRLTEQFFKIYGDAARGRQVHARLSHREPGSSSSGSLTEWPLRVVDIDLLRHVNNAAYWSIIEERLAVLSALRRQPLRAEVEHRKPIMLDERVEVVTEIDEPSGPLSCWISVDGEVRATAKVRVSPPRR